MYNSLAFPAVLWQFKIWLAHISVSFICLLDLLPPFFSRKVAFTLSSEEQPMACDKNVWLAWIFTPKLGSPQTFVDFFHCLTLQILCSVHTVWACRVLKRWNFQQRTLLKVNYKTKLLLSILSSETTLTLCSRKMALRIEDWPHLQVQMMECITNPLHWARGMLQNSALSQRTTTSHSPFCPSHIITWTWFHPRKCFQD